MTLAATTDDMVFCETCQKDVNLIEHAKLDSPEGTHVLKVSFRFMSLLALCQEKRA